MIRRIGYYIIDAWMRFDYISCTEGIAVLGIAGFCYFALDLLQMHFANWQRSFKY